MTTLLIILGIILLTAIVFGFIEASEKRSRALRKFVERNVVAEGYEDPETGFNYGKR
jgi:hypothetical protein